MSALTFLVSTFATLYLTTFLLRIMLQAVRADFYNPISQFIVRVTNPLVVPARRILPSTRAFDFPTLVVLIVLEIAFTALLLTLVGLQPRLDYLLGLSVVRLIYLTIRTYIFLIFLSAILTWFAQAAYSPIAMLLRQLVEPVLRPARRILPPIGGLDLSPLVVIVLLYAAMMLFNDTVAPLLLPGSATGLVN